MTKDIKLLEEVSLFRGIDANEISDILNCLDGRVKQYSKSQMIIRSGEEFNSLGIILSGEVQIIREDIMGNRMIVAGLTQGEIFGETFACAGVNESPVSVIAGDTSRILWISIKRIVTACSNACSFHTRMITNLLELLAKKNLYLNNKIEMLSKRSIRDKIMTYLALQAQQHNTPSFDILLNRNELADFLCIDRSAMSRELSRLSDEGIIEYQKNHFRIIKSGWGVK